MERLVQRFLLYLRAKRNVSAHTLRAYQHDLNDYRTILASKYPHLSSDRSHRLVVRNANASEMEAVVFVQIQTQFVPVTWSGLLSDTGTPWEVTCVT